MNHSQSPPAELGTDDRRSAARALAQGEAEETLREALARLTKGDEADRRHGQKQERYRQYLETRAQHREAVVGETMDEVDRERQRTGYAWPDRERPASQPDETRASRRRGSSSWPSRGSSSRTGLRPGSPSATGRKVLLPGGGPAQAIRPLPSLMGRTSARGYGTAHQRARKRWARQVEQGGVACARCGRQILPGTPWDLDHSPDRSGYLGPSHRRCNRSTANRRQPATRASAATADSRDDPERGVYWGPPSEPGQAPRQWSRHWFDWRTEELERRNVAE